MSDMDVCECACVYMLLATLSQGLEKEKKYMRTQVWVCVRVCVLTSKIEGITHVIRLVS